MAEDLDRRTSICLAVPEDTEAGGLRRPTTLLWLGPPRLTPIADGMFGNDLLFTPPLLQE